jgi:hypothetical protein
MTSISSASFQRPSPRDMLQTSLASQVQSGAISASDESALSSALDSIDKTLSSERSASSGGTPPSPTDMKKKVESLIDDQVSAGTLSSDQASELKDLFQTTFGNGPQGAGGHGGPGGPGGAGGPPPGPPPGQQADGDSDTDSSSSSSSSDIQSLLSDFLKQIQDKMGNSSTSYSGSGSSSSSSSSSTTIALFYNQTA